MKHDNLLDRTRQFAMDAIQLAERVVPRRSMNVVARQLVRSATSVGANYRAACRARSRADFIAKLKIVEEEAVESAYWIELLLAVGATGERQASGLLREANELTAIVVASIRTARRAIGRS